MVFVTGKLITLGVLVLLGSHKRLVLLVFVNKREERLLESKIGITKRVTKIGEVGYQVGNFS